MASSPLILVHVCAATVGLLSGFLAMSLRKGSGLHAAAGNVFFVSMLAMTSSAVYIAIFLHPVGLNLVVALLTLYLVSTAWRAARRRDGGTDMFDLCALLFIVGVGAAGIAFGIEAANSPTQNGIPTPAYFIFGGIALLCGLSDIRMFRGGGAVGARRIERHLWRMSLALLIATFSFYPGQARLFPIWLRETNLLWIPDILLVGAMMFHGVRASRRRRAERAAVAPELRDDALVNREAGGTTAPGVAA